MSRLVLGALCMLCAQAMACTTTNVAEPSDAATPGSDPASLQADVVVEPAPEAAGVGTRSTAAPSTKPAALPYNCQAPLMVIEEVTRLLTVASTHATRSAACVDGPGHRVTIDEILVCPLAPDGPRRPFAVTYRVSTWPEGGRQVCGGHRTPQASEPGAAAKGAECPPVEPEVTYQRTELAFRSDKAGHVIEPPSTLPGLPLDATPATSPHDGDCYGKSEPFVPRPLELR